MRGLSGEQEKKWGIVGTRRDMLIQMDVGLSRGDRAYQCKGREVGAEGKSKSAVGAGESCVEQVVGVLGCGRNACMRWMLGGGSEAGGARWGRAMGEDWDERREERLTFEPGRAAVSSGGFGSRKFRAGGFDGEEWSAKFNNDELLETQINARWMSSGVDQKKAVGVQRERRKSRGCERSVREARVRLFGILEVVGVGMLIEGAREQEIVREETMGFVVYAGVGFEWMEETGYRISRKDLLVGWRGCGGADLVCVVCQCARMESAGRGGLSLEIARAEWRNGSLERNADVCRLVRAGGVVWKRACVFYCVRGACRLVEVFLDEECAFKSLGKRVVDVRRRGENVGVWRGAERGEANSQRVGNAVRRYRVLFLGGGGYEMGLSAQKHVAEEEMRALVGVLVGGALGQLGEWIQFEEVKRGGDMGGEVREVESRVRWCLRRACYARVGRELCDWGEVLKTPDIGVLWRRVGFVDQVVARKRSLVVKSALAGCGVRAQKYSDVAGESKEGATGAGYVPLWEKQLFRRERGSSRGRRCDVGKRGRAQRMQLLREGARVSVGYRVHLRCALWLCAARSGGGQLREDVPLVCLRDAEAMPGFAMRAWTQEGVRIAVRLGPQSNHEVERAESLASVERRGLGSRRAEEKVCRRRTRLVDLAARKERPEGAKVGQARRFAVSPVDDRNVSAAVEKSGEGESEIVLAGMVNAEVVEGMRRGLIRLTRRSEGIETGVRTDARALCWCVFGYFRGCWPVGDVEVVVMGKGEVWSDEKREGARIFLRLKWRLGGGWCVVGVVGGGESSKVCERGTVRDVACLEFDRLGVAEGVEWGGGGEAKGFLGVVCEYIVEDRGWCDGWDVCALALSLGTRTASSHGGEIRCIFCLRMTAGCGEEWQWQGAVLLCGLGGAGGDVWTAPCETLARLGGMAQFSRSVGGRRSVRVCRGEEVWQERAPRKIVERMRVGGGCLARVSLRMNLRRMSLRCVIWAEARPESNWSAEKIVGRMTRRLERGVGEGGRGALGPGRSEVGGWCWRKDAQ
ncbi:hypothetical protein Tco_1400935 [Tanacetum coccineum]